MAFTPRSNLVYVDQLQEAVAGAYAGMIALSNTGAAILSTSLPTIGAGGQPLKGGDTVRVPYFNTIGELDDLTEGGALTPNALTMSSETATVVHSGKAGEITNWAQLTAQFTDPYAEFGKQFAIAYQRRIDQGLLTKAATTGLVKDISAVGSGQMSYDGLCDAVALWGDEGNLGDIVLMVVHSKVLNDMYKLRDSSGRPLLMDSGEVGGMPVFRGIPVKMSDRIGVTSGVYDNLICKRGALAAWVNGEPKVQTDVDVLADSDVLAIHTYHIEHIYQRPAGLTKQGVIKLQCKAST